jgi:hypothetical protein
MTRNLPFLRSIFGPLILQQSRLCQLSVNEYLAAKKLITPERNRLHGQIIEAGECKELVGSRAN